jgi:putative DNA primase/helicase
MTTASIFRVIEDCQPTLLIDEADTFLNKEGNEDITGIINSGHERIFAFVMRVDGDANNRKVKRFSTWTPMVISMIRLPKGTIVDRSLHIQMKRKLTDQTIGSWSHKKYTELKPFRQKLQRWANDSMALLEESPYTYKDKTDLTVFDGYSDRVKDNWSPLFAIASLLDDKWVMRLAAAIETLGRVNDNEPNSVGVELLHDIKSIFEYRGVTSIYSNELTEDLNAMDDRRWNSFIRGRPINTHTVGRILSSYLISSKRLYSGQDRKRGYMLEDFKDAFGSYL